MKTLTLSIALALLLTAPSTALSADVKIAAIRVQGNIDMPDDEVIALAGINVGDAFEKRMVAEIEKRLLRSGKFESAEVRTRYRSLSGGDVYLVLSVVEEASLGSKFMFSPIFGESGGYGFTIGVQTAIIDLLGLGERVYFPVTCGGVKRIGAGIDFEFGEAQYGKIQNRLTFTADLLDREDPHFEIDDDRVELGASFSSRIRFINFTLSGLWSDVNYGDLETDFWTYGLELALDTRRDSNLPGDAAYAGIGWEKHNFGDVADDVNVLSFDLRGYKLLLGQWQLAGQFYYASADSAIPDFQKQRLGGGSTLRGYPSSEFVGDEIIHSSLEVRVPLTKVLDRYRAGVHFFYDNGAVLDFDQDISEADYHHAIGVGTFVFATILQARLELAYDLDGYARFHIGSGFRF